MPTARDWKKKARKRSCDSGEHVYSNVRQTSAVGLYCLLGRRTPRRLDSLKVANNAVETGDRPCALVGGKE